MVTTIMMRAMLRTLGRRSRHMRSYQRAAQGYFAYGCVYLFGAALQLTPDRQHDFYGIPWWAFFVVGAALVVVVPRFIWRGYRRFTQVMSIFPGIKAMTLLMKQGKLMGAGEPTNTYNWFFVVVALSASVLMMRAGFGRTNAESEE